MFLCNSFGARLKAILTLSILSIVSPVLFSQTRAVETRTPSGAPKRLAFVDAKRLLEGETEGNISHRPGGYSETRLRSGQILELFYPLNIRSSSSGSTKTGKATAAAGYGLLHESRAAWEEAKRPRHILEELLPDGRGFVTDVPALVARLEKRLRVGAKHLDYSRASLKRVDLYLTQYRRTHSTADSDSALFQELTAYYGEVLKRELAGRWLVRNENIAQKRAQTVPNVAYELASVRHEMKPWSSVLNVLYNEDRRGLTLTASFDSDLRTARN